MSNTDSTVRQISPDFEQNIKLGERWVKDKDQHSVCANRCTDRCNNV